MATFSTWLNRPFLWLCYFFLTFNDQLVTLSYFKLLLMHGVVLFCYGTGWMLPRTQPPPRLHNFLWERLWISEFSSLLEAELLGWHGVAAATPEKDAATPLPPLSWVYRNLKWVDRTFLREVMAVWMIVIFVFGQGSSNSGLSPTSGPWRYSRLSLNIFLLMCIFLQLTKLYNDI